MTPTSSRSETHLVASNTQIIIYNPPGSSILDLRSYILQSPTSVAIAEPNLPSGLKSAIAVRFSVYVYEQHFSAKEEIDSDDPRSWHWVALAAPRGRSALSGNERAILGDGETGTEHIVASTLRLVPVSSLLPAADFHGASPHGFAEGPSRRPTALWDGCEPYIKIGRLATLPSHRRMGFGKLLVESAVEWAGLHREILCRPNGGSTEGIKEGSSEYQWNGLILVHAQKQIKRYWEKLGFVEDEGLGVWYEEGYEHIGMWKRITMG